MSVSKIPPNLKDGSKVGIGKYAGTRRKRKRINAKKDSTPGRMKGENCQATPLQKGAAKHNRFYRTYPEEYSVFRRQKNGSKSQWLSDSEWETMNSNI